MSAPVPDPSLRDEDGAWVSTEVDALAAAWNRGERVTAEEVLARRPGLSTLAAVRLIYEETSLRREAGEEVITSEVVRRFPTWRDELELLLDCDRLIRSPASALEFPEPGQGLGPFRLVAELGRGASGRTYLATDPALADRTVVLKVIPDDLEEHLSLARLQHTHIVPLFSEWSLPDQGLRTLCMPDLGGASLARVLEALETIPPGSRRGRQIVEALDRARPREAIPSTDDGPCRRYLEQASYEDAVCWIGACLADALEYAHLRDLIHMDVKPSNVLIAGDGQPMLLDFHLARPPSGSGRWVVDRLGGTRGWMSPEQARAIEAVRQGRPAPETIDRRSDIYTLGLLLAESLGGPGARAEAAAGLPWRQRNPRVSVGLADLVRKCLAQAPSDRYQDARALADDLRRHLAGQPLVGVAERSSLERLRKWHRRRPGALARGAAGLAATAAAVLALWLASVPDHRRTLEIENDLRTGHRLIDDGRFPEAIRILDRGLARSRAFHSTARLSRVLARQLARARRARTAAELHALTDLIRFRFGIDPPAPTEAGPILRACRAVWEDRDRLLWPGGEALEAEAEARLRADLVELAVVWSDLRVRLARPEDAPRARREALRVLDEAVSALGPGASIARERRLLAGDPEGPTGGETTSPRATAGEHYDLARFLLRDGRFAQALEAFRRAVALRPQEFWPNFYEGVCAYRLGRFAEALAAFRAAVSLAPDAPQCYYNRALAAEALGRSEEASGDYSRALELDPRFADAALNRGILAYRGARPLDAIADFRRALDALSDPETIGKAHYNLALAFLARGDRPSALASLARAEERGCREAVTLRSRLPRGS